MKALWTYIGNKKWSEEARYKAALLILQIPFALAGFAVWSVVRIWTLSSWDWMICFTGYAVLISWLVFFVYACRHEFREKENF